MKIRSLLLVTCLSLVSTVNGHAAIVSGYGAVADLGTYDSCASICLRPGGLDDQVIDGGELATSASAAIDNGTAASFGSAAFTGDVFSPVLRAWSASPPGSDNASDAIVTAVQAWTYLGSTPQDYSISLSMSGTIIERDSSAEGSIEGRAAVYLFPNATFGTDFSSFILEEVAGSGELLDHAQMFLLPNLDLSSDLLEFTAKPGDEFFIWMQLETKSERGATVDALSTYEMSFSAGDRSLLRETVRATVPAPLSLWLLGAGLAGVCAFRSRPGSIAGTTDRRQCTIVKPVRLIA